MSFLVVPVRLYSWRCHKEGRFGGVDMPQQPYDPDSDPGADEPVCAAAFPDVETREVTRDWEFVVMACDGIWDVLTNQVSSPCHRSSEL